MVTRDNVARERARVALRFSSTFNWFRGARTGPSAEAMPAFANCAGRSAVPSARTTLMAGLACLSAMFGAQAAWAGTGSLGAVSAGFNGLCTVASPSSFSINFSITATEGDFGPGESFYTYLVRSDGTIYASYDTLAIVGAGQQDDVWGFALNEQASAPWTFYLVDNPLAQTGTYVSGADQLDSLTWDPGSLDPDCSADLAAPTVTEVSRFSPAAEKTAADSLVWRVAFSEDVQNVDVADFVVTGSTATATAVSEISPSLYQVTVSGGDLAGLSAGSGTTSETVSLGFAAAQDVEDLASNALAATTPSGANESYQVSNSKPVLLDVLRGMPNAEITNADTVSWYAIFAGTSSMFSVSDADFTLTGTTADLAVSTNLFGFTVTASGGDLASLDGPISISLNAGVTDEFGNVMTSASPTGNNQDTYTIDNTSPGVVLTGPVGGSVSGAFTVTATFTEDVAGVELADFTVGNGTASSLQPVSALVYTVTITPDTDGPVTVDVDADTVVDAAGNANSAAPRFSINAVSDATPPSLTSIERLTPATATTNADSLTWRVTFDEGVSNVDASDFVGIFNDFGSTGSSSGSMAVSAISAIIYDVTLSGGELSSGRGTYALTLAGAQNIADLAGNALIDTTPTGVNEIYDISNTAPVLASVTRESPSDELTSADSLTWDFQFAAISSAMSLTASDFTLTGSTATLSVSRYSIGFTVTASGGDLATFDGPVSIALNDGFVDEYGNALATGVPTGVNQNSYTLDNTVPVAVLSTAVSAPVTGAFTLDIEFSEAVTGFALDDLTVGNGVASDLAGSENAYSVLITPATDGDITVDLAAAAAQDAAGNDNLSATQFLIAVDATAPSVVLSTAALGPVSGAFTLDVVFSEAVADFALDDLTVGNGTASDLAGSEDVYSVVITPASDGDVTVDLDAAVAQDSAGNGNLAATQFVIRSDVTGPGLTLTLPATEAEGPFTISFAFSEDVAGFELADLSVVNGDVADFTVVSASVYTARVTPQTLGTVTVSVAAAAAQDLAGNDSTASTGSLEAVSSPITVEVVISEDVVDVTDVSAMATVTNPGSQPVAFQIEVDVPWIDVDPMSGTIPALGELMLNISVNAVANDLAPGAYTGTITVINDSGGSAIAKGAGAVSRASGDSIVVEIPLTISIAERYGSLQLVATTPGGLQRDESFVFSSADSEIDGLALITNGGNAASAVFRRPLGIYDAAQAVPPGWRLEAISCVGDTDSGSVIDLGSGRVNIDLDPNESIVCTFANTRDEAEVLLATQRAIRNFMVRRADRLLSAAPDLANRIRERATMSSGHFAADINGGNRTISMGTSLSGLRNHAKIQGPQMPGDIAAQDGADTALDMWLAGDYSALSDDRAGDAADSAFGVVQVGVDWRFDERTLFGVMVQYDWMDETSDDIAEQAGAIRGARTGGTGWMAGPYLVHELGDGAFLDVLAMWGQSENTVDPLGLYEDAFSTKRYMLRANITGEWATGPWRVRPRASVAHFAETQDGYTDSFGIVIPQQTIAIGRVEAGPQIAYRIDTPSGGWWEPSVELTGVWDYDAARLMDEAGALVGTGGVRADARLGLHGQLAPGASLTLETSFAGLGDGEFTANGARIELRLSF